MSHGWQLMLAVGWALQYLSTQVPPRDLSRKTSVGFVTAWWLNSKGAGERDRENSCHDLPASRIVSLLPYRVYSTNRVYWSEK